MTRSLSKHNSAAMGKMIATQGKGVIRVKIDDNKRGPVTHHVDEGYKGKEVDE